MKIMPPTLQRFFLFIALAIGLTSTQLIKAQTVPALVNYQGRLANPDGTALATGDYQLTFRVYDAATNSTGLVWGPQVFDGSTGAGRGSRIPVVQGYFNVMLGPVDTNGVSLANAFNSTNRFVEIRVGTNNPILPRQQILSAPFAFNSAKLAGYDWSAVFGTNDPVNGRIPGAKLADGSVTALQIASNVFTGQVFASNQVWLATGNSGSSPGVNFVGTTDNQALEMRVNGQRALRVQPHATSPSLVGGHSENLIESSRAGAVIGGGGIPGYTNVIRAETATIGGGGANTIDSSASSATISGGFLNYIGASAWSATVGGGRSNIVGANSLYGTIGGGFVNLIGTNSSYSVIAGGDQNAIADRVADATISGGTQNLIRSNANFATVAGGFNNIIDPDAISAVVGGGRINRVYSNAVYATISGGYDNAVLTNADYATVAGGNGNRAGGDYSFAAGRRAKSLHDGSFVWADSTAADFSSGGSNQFLIRAAGGVGIGTTTPSSALQVVGTVTATAFNPPSDRNLKENFRPVSSRDVLDKVSTIPISRWNFKGDSGTPHLGPMAQDFHAAFGLGTDERHIATVDADGVALAAIQGLNQKLEEQLKTKDAEIKTLQTKVARIDLLEQRLNELERRTQAQTERR